MCWSSTPLRARVARSEEDGRSMNGSGVESDQDDAVLVVDDDPPVVRAITTTLKRSARTRAADSVAGAKALLDDAGPWVAFIFDGELADGSCFELLDYARARHPTVPALVLSGRTSKEFRDSVLAAGAAFMTKPFELPDLRAFVEAAKAAKASAAAKL
jgi:DNA-binding response OmpR family regulator